MIGSQLDQSPNTVYGVDDGWRELETNIISISNCRLVRFGTSAKLVSSKFLCKASGEERNMQHQSLHQALIAQQSLSALNMLCRTARRSILDVGIPSSALPPIFLLPSRARYFNSTAQHVEPPAGGFEASQLTKPQSSASPITSTIKPTHRSIPQPPPPASEPLALSDSVKELLPLLATQPEHYISAHIHGRPYLVTVGDVVRLPFHMPGVVPGDVLRLNRASSLGSRDYTLKGAPYLDERIF